MTNPIHTNYFNHRFPRKLTGQGTETQSSTKCYDNLKLILSLQTKQITVAGTTIHHTKPTEGYPMKAVFLVVSLTVIGLVLSGCSHLVAITSGNDPVTLKSTDRSFGTLIDDKALETTIEANLIKLTARHPEADIDVKCYNAVVLLTGYVPTEALKSKATDYAKRSGYTRSVFNELVVGPARTWPAKTSDTWLSTKINANMLATEGFPSRDVEVITENGVVYLMGIVSRETANTAVAITKRIHGVQRIIKLFEYTEDIAAMQEQVNTP